MFEANGVLDVDFTGSQILQQRLGELCRRDITVAVARLKSEPAKAAATRTGLIDAIGTDHVFRSVDGRSVASKPT